ncbi:MAG: ATP synthase F1 subunit gamma [Anaerolineales bacterium]|nr:ATP synthase F1 subunit gamma [Anaerolineales bacterium]
MASAREVRLRIRSVKNIAQVTRALQAVSASKVRKSMQALMHTRPYARQAWRVLTHIARQPGRQNMHHLLITRPEVRSILVVLITGDRGLAGAYNTNIVRFVLDHFSNSPVPVRYLTVGRKGRDLMLRRRANIIAEFSNLPAAPTYADVASIGKIAVEEFTQQKADQVALVYTDFVNMVKQVPVVKKLLPLEFASAAEHVDDYGEARKLVSATYIYEPSEEEILEEIVPRFVGLQVFQAILESLASEHAARMVAMKNATDSATDLADGLTLEYNKARQQTITNEMLDIAGGVEALARSVSSR